MASRKLEDLHPDLRPLAEWLVEECRELDIDILITCTWRSHAEQDVLYAQGRSKPGKIVTYARGGQSAHNFVLDGKPASKAFDVVPLIGGKPEWDAEHPVWQHVGELGESMGLEWAGRWKKFREYAHFQMRES
jgi:peptidoglycan L-alanyl-D-glutamate endopeptidase CwlK